MVLTGSNSYNKKRKKMKLIMMVIITAFSFLLYFDSIPNDYAIDDVLVMQGNTLVTKGIVSVPRILTTRYRQGYWETRNTKLNTENLYRPLSVAMFAIEWQLAPGKPWLGHLVNILLYAITGILMFIVLIKLLPDHNLIIPFITTLLFIGHPVHTEVIANIKSRDEILCFLFILASISSLINYINRSKIISLPLSLFYFFLALLSKENAITYLALVPLVMYFFTKVKLKKNVLISIYFAGLTVIYLLLRAWVLHGQLTAVQTKIAVVNNTLAAVPFGIARIASAIHILGKYLWLLVYPHPLAWDYSFNQIPIVFINDIDAVIPIIVYLYLIIYAFINFSKKNIISFCILFFFITISLVSNIFFLIEATMGERFLYTPSLGFCLAVAILLTTFFKSDTLEKNSTTIFQLFKKNLSLFLVIFAVLALYSVKTVTRNLDWRNGKTLNEKDVQTSTESVRCLYSSSVGLLYEDVPLAKTKEEKMMLIDSAIKTLQKCIHIYKYNDNPEYYLTLGKAYKEKRDTVKALAIFEEVARAWDVKANIDGDFFCGLGNSMHELKNTKDADKYYDRALELNPKDVITLNNYSYYLSMRNEQLPKADSMAKLAVSLDSNDVMILDTYAWVLYKEKKYSEAVNCYDKAFAKGGYTNWLLLEHYGDVLYKQGDTTKAFDYWIAAKKIGGGTELLDKKIADKKLYE